MRKTLTNEYFDLDLINEWHGLFRPKRFNWVDFHFTDIHVEWDRIHGVFELEMILLGFGFRIYWVYNKKAMNKSVAKYEKILEKDEWVRV